MNFSLSDYEKILCLSLSAADVNVRVRKLKPLLEKVDLDILYKKAKTDEVHSHLAWLMSMANIEMKEKWHKALETTEDRISNLMAELDLVAECLAQNNIRVVGLKNAGIAKGIYKNNACSPMGDLDLLVSSSDFHNAHSLLINKLDYKFEFRSDLEEENLQEAFKSGGTEYYKEVNGYIVWLELQWRPVSGRWIQPDNEPDGDDLLQNSLQLPDSKVRVLAPEDNLLQVSLHTAKHSYCRAPGFRLHSDVDRIVRFTDIEWELFCKKVAELNVYTAVYFSLFFAEKLLNTPIPKKVMSQLEPSSFKKKMIANLIKNAGLFNQEEKKFSKIGYLCFGLLLFDNLNDLRKAIFPSKEIMFNKYQFNSESKLIYYYSKRILNLLFKREGI